MLFQMSHSRETKDDSVTGISQGSSNISQSAPYTREVDKEILKGMPLHFEGVPPKTRRLPIPDRFKIDEPPTFPTASETEVSNLPTPTAPKAPQLTPTHPPVCLGNPSLLRLGPSEENALSLEDSQDICGKQVEVHFTSESHRKSQSSDHTAEGDEEAQLQRSLNQLSLLQKNVSCHAQGFGFALPEPDPFSSGPTNFCLSNKRPARSRLGSKIFSKRHSGRSLTEPRAADWSKKLSSAKHGSPAISGSKVTLTGMRNVEARVASEPPLSRLVVDAYPHQFQQKNTYFEADSPWPSVISNSYEKTDRDFESSDTTPPASSEISSINEIVPSDRLKASGVAMPQEARGPQQPTRTSATIGPDNFDESIVYINPEDLEKHSKPINLSKSNNLNRLWKVTRVYSCLCIINALVVMFVDILLQYFFRLIFHLISFTLFTRQAFLISSTDRRHWAQTTLANHIIVVTIYSGAVVWDLILLIVIVSNYSPVGCLPRFSGSLEYFSKIYMCPSFFVLNCLHLVSSVSCAFCVAKSMTLIVKNISQHGVLKEKEEEEESLLEGDENVVLHVIINEKNSAYDNLSNQRKKNDKSSLDQYSQPIDYSNRGPETDHSKVAGRQKGSNNDGEFVAAERFANLWPKFYTSRQNHPQRHRKDVLDKSFSSSAQSRRHSSAERKNNDKARDQ